MVTGAAFREMGVESGESRGERHEERSQHEQERAAVLGEARCSMVRYGELVRLRLGWLGWLVPLFLLLSRIFPERLVFSPLSLLVLRLSASPSSLSLPA